MNSILEAHGLRKRFGPVVALDGLDLVMPTGQVVAILGPNGAGKSTFVRSVATLVRPDAGRLEVAGVDALAHPRRVRRLIGLAGQSAAVEPALTGRENLRMIARLFGHDRRASRRAADAVLAQLSLTDAADRLVRTYSGGMRRRLDLGASLVGAPRLLLLDEPTTGLDPRSRNGLWTAIEQLVADGTDVLLTTQYLDEADRLADLVVIVDHGRVIAAGAPGELKTRIGGGTIEVHVRDQADLTRAAAAMPGDPTVDVDRRLLSLPAGGSDRLIETIRALDLLDIPLDDVALRQPSLDDVFLTLTAQPSDLAKELS